MKKDSYAFINRIREELREIKHIVMRVQVGWERTATSGDDFYLDSVALNLHSFYTALERIFELIAVNVDRSKPKSDNWHQELLRQMTLEVKLIRPPVLSQENKVALDEYRGFRHVVRNVYSYHLSQAKIAPLVQRLPQVFGRSEIEIESFLSFLESRADN